MHAAALLNQVSPPLDKALVEALIIEFIDLERRFVLGDWEPATLNGGQFAEIAARIVYHIDSGNLNRRKGVNECLKYIEDKNNSNNHSFPQRRAALHLCRVLRTIYKFRSQRGAVHIDPDYTANELDSTLVLALSRWTMSEILRLFWTGATIDIARVIREIVRFRVPAVLEIDNHTIVLRTDCTTEEEILILLHHAGESGLTRREIGKSAMKPPSSVTEAIQKLTSRSVREVVQLENDRYVLTPNGTKRIHNELSEKLVLS